MTVLSIAIGNDRGVTPEACPVREDAVVCRGVADTDLAYEGTVMFRTCRKHAERIAVDSSRWKVTFGTKPGSGWIEPIEDDDVS